MHRSKWSFFPIVVLGSAILFGCSPGVPPADLVLHNGKVVTVDDAKPEAEAVAVRAGVIVAVGSNSEVERFIGDQSEVIDLGGKLAIPGFIEGHGHFMSLGTAKLHLDLMHVKNWDEVIAMVQEAVAEAKPGDWVVGHGWHQEKWDNVPTPNVEGFPTHEALSKVSPENPVFLTHASGHASFANAKAMELAGVTRTTPNPHGGEILKDRRGNPIGIFREMASGLIQQALSQALAARSPEQREEEARRAFQLATQECLSNGVTSFQDAGSSFETIDFFKKMADEGKMDVRLWVMVRESNEQMADKLAQYKIIGYGDKRLTVRGVKKSIDGALGPRGAWLLEPYADLPTRTGLNLTPIEHMKEAARLAIQHGYQFCVHAIGDRANRETLDIFEEAFKEVPNAKDLRWRVEHAQHLHPADIPRFAQLGVLPSMQGIHCTSDAPFVIARLGEQRAGEGAYVWQSLMRSGATIINGTDAPVEDISPIENFYASVSRTLKDGSVFFPEQRMSREEALRSYTINAAYGAFEEKEKGSLTPGKLADIVVLSKDIMTIPEDEIPSTEVVYIIVGGKVKHRK